MVRRPLVRVAVIKAVPENVVGAYFLGLNTSPMPRYVGRSDISLRQQLLAHTDSEEFQWFSPVVSTSVYHAFRDECAGWHLLHRLGIRKQIHPTVPAAVLARCPVCDFADTATSYWSMN